ncbi:MAG: hypothetical protein HQL56_12750 [Magnetococcales bacterium]|nr:hypothetical protein [Magnetococcales bacterium]
MNDLGIDLFLWARGTGWVVSLSLFCFGLTLRLAEILLPGRLADLSAPRPQARQGSPWKTVLMRNLPYPGLFRRSPVTYVAGYLFHGGFLAALLLGSFHMEWFRSLLGFGWPTLPTPVADLFAFTAILSLAALLISRLTHPVKRLLSGVGDYLAWTLSMLPLLTGWLAYHHVGPYVPMLLLHLLSAELLLALLPFTPLMHAFTIWMARWYSGQVYGRKGVQA